MTRAHNGPGGPDSKEGEAYGLVLGQVIAQLRKQHGNMTQAELAHRLGISQSMLSKIESGKQPDAYHFNQIAQAFGLDVQQLNAQVLDAMKRAQRAAEAVTNQPKASSGWGELLALAGFVGLVMFAVAAVVGDDAKPPPEPTPGPKPKPQ
ncbi:helix-turn-helix transcriptional regulator [Corallococcus sp. bb12-1]|uniref:helix-turn-helix domain-containing protein n=1 Tax=Corallococcus sp. bb12-1 TaxID=2996784 RepID=UPI00226E90CF|nr:helix-turn-helix transcriptional regulator [Corallococcus sp. bb12-1]MCY1046058.1 helix-turn-helix transcriptional regulator [Corallococcus sp. bb12-1]